MTKALSSRTASSSYSIGATAMIVSKTLPASAEATPGSAAAGVVPDADPRSPDQLRQVEQLERETLKHLAETFVWAVLTRRSRSPHDE